MQSARVLATVFLAAFLGAGPAAASVADCCPPRPLAAPALAAAGCCGECPSSLTPAPEPASLSVKASRPDRGLELAPAASPDLAVRSLDEAGCRVFRPSLASPPRLSPVPLRV